MRKMAAALLVLAAALPIAAAPASAQTIGVVLMHGNTDSPQGVIYSLATALHGAGYLVEPPEMCWSRRRLYDRSFPHCLTEIDSAIGRLKGGGAARIVVVGHS